MFPGGGSSVISKGCLMSSREEIEFLIEGWYRIGSPVKGHLWFQEQLEGTNKQRGSRGCAEMPVFTR